MINLTPRSSEDGNHYDECIDVIRKPGFGGYIGRVFPIRRAVKKMQPQIIHAHYLTGGGFYGRWCGRRPLVNTVWGSDIYVDALKWQLRPLVKSAIRGSDVITCDSEHIMNAVRAVCPTVRVHKLLIGVETNIFYPKPELRPKTFTFLSGRSSYPIYNCIRIVKAFEMLDGSDSRLLLQKSRNPYPELEEVVEESPLRDRIDWYPIRNYSEMPDLFNKAHVTISIPSSDSSSATMMESMSCGVPVIASKIPANDEWDGLGIYVPKDDSVEALADLMRKVMEHPELVEAYGKFAREIIIQRADWNKQMEGLVRLYEELLE
jgi:glycosyltransferase involved in cell wall biosynthesis